MSNDLNAWVSRWSGGCCASVRRCHGYYKQWRGLPLGCGASSCASLVMRNGGSGASRLGSCRLGSCLRWTFPTRLDACASFFCCLHWFLCCFHVMHLLCCRGCNFGYCCGLNAIPARSCPISSMGLGWLRIG